VVYDEPPRELHQRDEVARARAREQHDLLLRLLRRRQLSPARR
jgi:hypothetical protein